MAHIAKYKATSVGHMLAHYRRDPSSLGRENIDPARVGMDYTLALDPADGLVKPMKGVEPNWATVEGRIERVNERAKAEGKRAVRKDAVVMADVVVTLPENVREGDEGAFFGWTYCFLADRLGSGNMLGGFVHRDEVRTDGSPVRDHMHAAFTPIVDGRFNYKKMCPRAFYQSLHKELGDYLEKQMGYRPEVELGDETRAMRVYADKSTDIDKVRGAVERGIVEPAEQQAAQAVEDAAQRVEDAAQRVEEARAELDELRGAVSAEQARLESLRQGTRAIERDVAELRPVAAEIGRWEAADRAGKRAILDSIAARCDGLRGRVEKVVEGIRGAVGRLEMAIAGLSRKLAPRSARMTTRALKRDLAALERDMSPVTLASEARDAARASSARRGNVPQRGRGQAR